MEARGGRARGGGGWWIQNTNAGQPGMSIGSRPLRRKRGARGSRISALTRGEIRGRMDLQPGQRRRRFPPSKRILSLMRPNVTTSKGGFAQMGNNAHQQCPKASSNRGSDRLGISL